MLACGMDPRGVMAELAGNGAVQGKGGSMHIFSAEHMLGGNGIVGAQVPMATGVALADYRGRPRVLTCFGDGAVHQGRSMKPQHGQDLEPARHLSGENNKYGMGTASAVSPR